MGPVSYTHLDVYKRQDVYVADALQIPNILIEIGRLREYTFRQVGEGSGKACDLDITLNGRSAAQFASEAVSYTHLDVYKRQA